MILKFRVHRNVDFLNILQKLYMKLSVVVQQQALISLRLSCLISKFEIFNLVPVQV